jgi:hypothetical protein
MMGASSRTFREVKSHRSSLDSLVVEQSKLARAVIHLQSGVP